MEMANLILGILTALGTLAAVGVALLVANREHTARVAADQRAEAVEARDRLRVERAQASRVVVYKDEAGRTDVVVNNASDLPVYGATVFAGLPHVGDDLRVVSESELLIRAGQPKHFAFQLLEPIARGIAMLAVVFRDADDRWWLRTGHGVLEPAPADPDEALKLVRLRLLEQWKVQAATHQQAGGD